MVSFTIKMTTLQGYFGNGGAVKNQKRHGYLNFHSQNELDINVVKGNPQLFVNFNTALNPIIDLPQYSPGPKMTPVKVKGILQTRKITYSNPKQYTFS